VCASIIIMFITSDHGFLFQNKRGKYDRHDDRGEGEKAQEEQAEDPLKDATTLYVGNLYGF
jgi:hypothetical protein